MDIGEVAKRSGLPVSTLRFYDEMGLIQSTGRNGLRRLFAPTVLEKLSLIALGTYAGFSLAEIAAIFSPDGRTKISRSKLMLKAAEIEHTIKRLMALRDGLHHAANCPVPNQLDCPKFQRLIRFAGNTQLKRRGKKKQT